MEQFSKSNMATVALPVFSVLHFAMINPCHCISLDDPIHYFDQELL